jgi:hypothetical protein
VTAAETYPSKVDVLTCITLPEAAGIPVQFAKFPLAGVPNAGATRVLFVSVSVVALPISVSVATGRVSVPEPATSGALMVMAPLVFPATIISAKIILLLTL